MLDLSTGLVGTTVPVHGVDAGERFLTKSTDLLQMNNSKKKIILSKPQLMNN